MAKKLLIEFNGKIACLSEHCRDLKVKITTVQSRHHKTGEPYEKCLEYYQKNGVKKKGIAKKLMGDYGVKDFILYQKWYNAKDRCENPKNPMYPRYGGRGIKVCERWQVYENFENDLLESFLEHVEQFGLHDTQIERIDYNRDYEPSNVTWATIKEQANNKSSNRMVTKDLNVMQFAEKYNINYGTVLDRLNRGWSVEEILDPSLRYIWRDRIPTGESLDELAERVNISKDIIMDRFYRGWDFQKAITTPVQNKVETPTGETIPQLAKRLGVSRQAIHQRLQKGQSWDKILNDLS